MGLGEMTLCRGELTPLGAWEMMPLGAWEMTPLGAWELTPLRAWEMPSTGDGSSLQGASC